MNASVSVVRRLRASTSSPKEREHLHGTSGHSACGAADCCGGKIQPYI